MSNWHWKTYACKAWADTWFSEKILPLETENLKVTKVENVEGDCELGMRKSKLVTIYDLRLQVAFSQKQEAPEGEEPVTGTLTALEVSHDMDEDEYQFETSASKSGDLAMKYREEARTKLANQLRPIFQQFPKDMVATHGNVLLKDAPAPATAPPTGSSTQKPSASSGAAPAAVASSKTETGKAVNTTSVRVEAPFKIAAADLFELLTDPSKVPMWTRNPAQIKPEAGADVSLFGGNVTGKIISVNKPTEIVMSWRPPQWEAGHFGTLTMSLVQGTSDTSLVLKLSGVPIGSEEETEKNLDVFYIRSLKQMGLGTIL